jgi:hypothetical protein
MSDVQLYDELNAPNLLGSNLQQSYFGYTQGGGGYLLLTNRVLFGGTGFSSTASDITPRGQVTMKMGGGIGQIGYLILNKNRWLAFPYLGMGRNDITMKLRNNTSNNIFDLGNLEVLPGETMELRAKTVDFDFGFTMQYFVFHHYGRYRSSGFMLGLQAGTYAFVGIEDWHVKNEVNQISGLLSKPSIFMPYFRITIGGGGFRTINKDEASLPRR